MRRRTSSGLFSALLLAVTSASAEELLVDGVAAQVGSQIVLVSEVMQSVGPQEAAMREAGVPEREIAKVRAAGLEHMIEARLIEDLVRQTELYASDEEVDATIESIARENGLSLEQLEASVVFHGMAFDAYREQIKRDIERRNVVNAVVGSKITVDEEEVQALYREKFANQPQGGTTVHVRQLLVTYGGESGRDQASACAIVETADQRIRNGETFPVVAKELSEVAPQMGGDIGWLHLDSVAPWMSNALASLDIGDTSEVVTLPFGCTLLNLVERREFSPVTYEQARDILAQEVWEREIDAGYREWIEDLRSKTYIDRRGYFADAAQFGVTTFGTREAPESSEP